MVRISRAHRIRSKRKFYFIAHFRLPVCKNETLLERIENFPPGDVLPPSKETDIKLNIRSNLGRSLSLKVMKKKKHRNKNKNSTSDPFLASTVFGRADYRGNKRFSFLN